MAQLINEAERFQKLAGVISESQFLNEVEVPSFLIQQVLKNETDKSNRGNVELKVGTKYVLPKKYYGSMQEIREKIGTVTKIEGDKIYIEDLKGEEHQYSANDLIFVSGLNESLDIESTVNEALTKFRKNGK